MITKIVSEINSNDFFTLLLIGSLLLTSGWLAFERSSHSLWYDEAVTAKIVSHDNLDEVVRSSFTTRPYPPLYFVITHFSSKLFEGEFGLRFPSIVFGVLAGLGVSFLARALFGNLIGLLSVLLFVTTPGVFRHFVDANAYSLMLFSIVAATYCCYMAVTKGNSLFWLGFTFFSLVSLATHLFSVFHLFANILAGYYLSGSLESAKHGYTRSRILSVLRKEKWLTICSTVLICGWIYWTYYYFNNQGVNKSAQFSNILSTKTLLLPLALYFGFLSKGMMMQILAWPFLQLLGVLKCFVEDKRKLIFLLIEITIPALLISISQQVLLPFFTYRYGIGVFAFACILSANSAYLLKSTIANKAKYIFVRVFVFLAISFHAISGLIGTGNDALFEIQQWRQAAQYLEARVLKKDNLYFVHDWRYPSLEYYFETPSNIYLVQDHSGLITKLRADLITRDTNHAKRIWIVIESLANNNAMIEKFFGHKKQMDEHIRILVSDLKNQFQIEDIGMEKFRGVTVVSFDVSGKT